MDNDTSEVKEKKTRGKFTVKILIVTVAMIVLLVVGIILSDILEGASSNVENEIETVDPSKLHETKEEGFDIM